MKCKFCYATFQDFKVEKQLSIEEACLILFKLKNAGVKKVTFAGGEPMLYKNLDAVIMYAKSIGLVTSVITNGSMITYEWLEKMKPYLDWIGVSIDSLNEHTNIMIGRVAKEPMYYHILVDMINSFNYKLKINTVVNIHNQREYMRDFIDYSGTKRWKVFDTLKVDGQNDKEFDNIKSTNFDRFLRKNEHPYMVVEPNALMISAYVLIDPKGRLFEDTLGTHTYSDSLLNESVEHCMSQITLNRQTFLERGGLYDW